MTRRRLAVGAVAAGSLVVVAVVLVDPFGGPSAASSSLDNGAATSVASVVRRDLSSQTKVSATLGYAGASTLSVPGGTAPATLQQAQQSVASAQATLAADASALVQAQATLAADTRKLAVDCAGANAAEGTGSGLCATDAQAMTTDRQSVTGATTKVEADRRALATAQAALAQARDSAATYGQNAAFTMLPKVGQILRRGDALYAVDGQSALLLYGSVPASRAFVAGMTPGPDVGELNRNLRALGYGASTGDGFTAATAAAIARLQKDRGLQATGQLLLGSVAFEPGAVRVTSVTPTLGASVQAGAVLGITSTRRVVTIALDASAQASVKVGDPVVITLPDNSTTPGHVSYVGTVATTPSSNNGGSSTPTIEVDVTPDHPSETGRIDQATVDVSITTDTVHSVLAVPVNALLALATGGYAVEEIEAGGVHRLVAVSVGLFDDAEGIVEVRGAGLAAGQHVVVPSS